MSSSPSSSTIFQCLNWVFGPSSRRCVPVRDRLQPRGGWTAGDGHAGGQLGAALPCGAGRDLTGNTELNAWDPFTRWLTRWPIKKKQNTWSSRCLFHVGRGDFARLLPYALTRSPSCALSLLFFWVGRLPLLKSAKKKKGYPYSKLSTGGPSLSCLHCFWCCSVDTPLLVENFWPEVVDFFAHTSCKVWLFWCSVVCG